MIRLRLVSGLVLLIAFPAFAQQTVHLPVDMRQPGNAARALEVDDDTLVLIDIAKTAFQTCTVDTKTEVLPAPPSPIGQALAALNPFLGGAGQPIGKVAVPAADRVLEDPLSALEVAALEALNDASSQRDAVRAALLAISPRSGWSDWCGSCIDGCIRKRSRSSRDVPHHCGLRFES